MTPLDPLRRFAPPRASLELRERVLTGARDAMTSSAAASRTERIWFSRRWRLAWVVTIATFVLVEAIFLRSARPVRAQLRPEVSATHEAAAAAAAIGISGKGFIGERVVTNDDDAHDAMEVPL